MREMIPKLSNNLTSVDDVRYLDAKCSKLLVKFIGIYLAAKPENIQIKAPTTK